MNKTPENNHETLNSLKSLRVVVPVARMKVSLPLLTADPADQNLVAAYQEYQRHFPNDYRSLVDFLVPHPEVLREVEVLATEGRWSHEQVRAELAKLVANNKQFLVEYWCTRIAQPQAPKLEDLLAATRGQVKKTSKE